MAITDGTAATVSRPDKFRNIDEHDDATTQTRTRVGSTDDDGFGSTSSVSDPEKSFDVSFLPSASFFSSGTWGEPGVCEEEVRNGVRVFSQQATKPNKLGPDTEAILEYFTQKQVRIEALNAEVADKSTNVSAGEKLWGEPTPLASLPSLARELNVKKILVKDEGKRLGLKAFKGAGVGFAVHELIDRIGKDAFYSSDKSLKDLNSAQQQGKPVLATMTDGNHGRAVARVAQKLGCDCVIYVPEIMSSARKARILEEGAKVHVDKKYDDAIETVSKKANEHGWHLIMDTSISGYPADVPSDIVAGYGGIIFGEAKRQLLADPSAEPITHLVLCAGVGSFCSSGFLFALYEKALLQNLKERDEQAGDTSRRLLADDVKLIVVEPTDAACLLENVESFRSASCSSATSSTGCGDSDSESCTKDYFLKDAEGNNRARAVDVEKILVSGAGADSLKQCKGKTESLMAGLNCGMPSLLAWPVIRDTVDTFVAVGNDFARRAVYKMHVDGIVSGESGAAGVAGMLAAPQLFDEDSVVLLVNTEADTDPDLYRSIVKSEELRGR